MTGAAPTAAGTTTVLLVEDSPPDILFAREIVTELPFPVELADIVLIDVNMVKPLDPARLAGAMEATGAAGPG